MYVQTQTLAEMAPSKDSIDPEDPTTTWVTTKSILLSETFPMEFTTGGTSSREIVKVKYLTLFLVRYMWQYKPNEQCDHCEQYKQKDQYEQYKQYEQNEQ